MPTTVPILGGRFRRKAAPAACRPAAAPTGAAPEGRSAGGRAISSFFGAGAGRETPPLVVARVKKEKQHSVQ